MIRNCVATDAPEIARIYNYYIRETVITFEEEPVSDPEMQRRIAEVTVRFPWLVWEELGVVAAFAYAAPWRSRAAYRHSVEATIYLDHHITGKGIGTKLYAALILELRKLDVHCVVGGAALPNAASIALHEKFGFSKVGEFPEIGRKHGKWVNVAYWQLVLRGADTTAYTDER
jgi:phosphinothricin acetyltransferase